MLLIEKNQAPKDPTCEFQATEEVEEDPVIPYTNIGLDNNHETPTKQVQAPKDPIPT